MGPVAGSINALLRTGWRPARSDLWQVEEDTTVEVSKQPFARFQTIARAQVDLQNEVWKQAAKHEHGGGLETGIPSFQAARGAMKYVRTKWFHVEATALEYVFVGLFSGP